MSSGAPASGAPDPATAALLREAAGFVYVDDLAAPSPSAEDAHHLIDVLRLRPGESVVAADGIGGHVLCEMGSAPPARQRSRTDRVTDDLLIPTGPVVRLALVADPVTVVFAMPKGERTEWTIQKLTEIGVDQIVPLLTERTVVRLRGDEVARRSDRLRRIAREAGAQSRRLHLPLLDDPRSFEEFVGGLEDIADAVAIAEPGGEPLAPMTHTVVVGPEGGWTDAELAAIPRRVGLGTTVLRAETAAIVVGTLLAARRWNAAENELLL